ncbi:MAG: TnsA endonuclease N-terminal domain-containing protein [Sandaracinobacter sp.]
MFAGFHFEERLASLQPLWSGSGPFGVQRGRARIVTAVGGGAIRTVITGRKHGMSSVHPSRKTGRPQPAESWGEAQLICQCEVDTAVVDYQAQHHRLELTVNGEPRVYVPDMVRRLADGRVEVIEVKASYVEGKKPAYDQKLAAAALIYEDLGWAFRLMRGRELTSKPVWSANCADVARAANTHLTAAEIILIEDYLARERGSATLGAVASQLGPYQIAIKQLCAAHVRRIICLDLDTPLGADTRVQFPIPSSFRLPEGGMKCPTR